MRKVLRSSLVVFLWLLLSFTLLPHNPGNNSRGLEFSKKYIAYDPLLPGRQNGIVYLQNTSPRTLTNITLITSCFCTTIDRAVHIATLAPGQKMPVPFILTI